METKINEVREFLMKQENHDAKVAFVKSLKGTRGRPAKVLTEEEKAAKEAAPTKGRGRPAKQLTES